MGGGEVRLFCKLDEAGESLIRVAMGQMNLSARGYHRVLKLARIIVDLRGVNRSRRRIWRRRCSIDPKAFRSWARWKGSNSWLCVGASCAGVVPANAGLGLSDRAENDDRSSNYSS